MSSCTQLNLSKQVTGRELISFVVMLLLENFRRKENTNVATFHSFSTKKSARLAMVAF